MLFRLERWVFRRNRKASTMIYRLACVIEWIRTHVPNHCEHCGEIHLCSIVNDQMLCGHCLERWLTGGEE